MLLPTLVAVLKKWIRDAAQTAAGCFDIIGLLSEVFAVAAEAGMQPQNLNVLAMLADVLEVDTLGMQCSSSQAENRQQQVLTTISRLRMLTACSDKMPVSWSSSPASAGQVDLLEIRAFHQPFPLLLAA